MVLDQKIRTGLRPSKIIEAVSSLIQRSIERGFICAAVGGNTSKKRNDLTEKASSVLMIDDIQHWTSSETLTVNRILDRSSSLNLSKGYVLSTALW
jgi:hypothetical protein